MATTAHKAPNYVLIWAYLFGLTVLEDLFAFEMPISRNLKILVLLGLAVWKALLVALFFMHLNFESGYLRLMVLGPLPVAAALYAEIISVGGGGCFAGRVSTLRAVLGARTLACYVLLYTPLKRRTSLNTLVGAVPGALPILGGWTAAGGRIDVAALSLFWILFLWQLPHFLALAWIYRDDYKNAGLAMLSVEDVDGRRTGWIVLLYALALLPVSLLPSLVGVTGPWYFAGAALLGIGFVASGAAMLGRATPRGAWRVVLASLPMGALPGMCVWVFRKSRQERAAEAREQTPR